MKKQINPTIKAHLIRGALYLILLVAVCAIPFALAQSRSRATAKQIAAKPTNQTVNRTALGLSPRRSFPMTLYGFQPIRLCLRRRVLFEFRRRSCQTRKAEME